MTEVGDFDVVFDGAIDGGGALIFEVGGLDVIFRSFIGNIRGFSIGCVVDLT